MDKDSTLCAVSVGAALVSLMVWLALYFQYNGAFRSGRLPGFSLAVVTFVWLVPFGLIGALGPLAYRKLRDSPTNVSGRLQQTANDPVPLIIGGAAILILFLVLLVYRSFGGGTRPGRAAATTD